LQVHSPNSQELAKRKKLPRSIPILLFQKFLPHYFLPLHVLIMEPATDFDIEKGVAVEPTEVHASTDNSTDRGVESERAHPATAEGKLGYWGLKMEAIWGVEARGITRVMDHEKNVARPLHDYLHMFSLWFSINLQAVNIIIGLLGPLVYGLGWMDCVCIVIFGNALASSGVAYLATFGPASGNRTMVCFPICHCFCKLILLARNRSLAATSWAIGLRKSHASPTLSSK
jgi:hypothetical protein